MKFLKDLKKCYLEFLLKLVKKKDKEDLLYKSSTTKRTMNSSATLKLSTQTEQKKKEIDETLENLIKEYINTPEKLMKYMLNQGMKVYQLKNANKLLLKLGEQEGFITPLRGKKALTLNMFLSSILEKKINISFKTGEMFIFNDGKVEIYTLARALYKYYGFKRNMPGYDYKSQEIYKKVYRSDSNKKSIFGGFSLNQLYACKEAMARDMESINFAISLSEKYAGSKNVLKKLQDDNSANI